MLGFLGFVVSTGLSAFFWIVPPPPIVEPRSIGEHLQQTVLTDRLERAGEAWLFGPLCNPEYWVQRLSNGEGARLVEVLATEDSKAMDPQFTSADDFVYSLQYVMEGKPKGTDQEGWAYWRHRLDVYFDASGDVWLARRAVGGEYIDLVVASGSSTN